MTGQQFQVIGMVEAILVVVGFAIMLRFASSGDGSAQGLRVKYAVGGVFAWLWLSWIDVADFFGVGSWQGPIRYIPFRTLSLVGVWYAVLFYYRRKKPVDTQQ